MFIDNHSKRGARAICLFGGDGFFLRTRIVIEWLDN